MSHDKWKKCFGKEVNPSLNFEIFDLKKMFWQVKVRGSSEGMNASQTLRIIRYKNKKLKKIQQSRRNPQNVFVFQYSSNVH